MLLKQYFESTVCNTVGFKVFREDEKIKAKNKDITEEL